MDQLILIFIAIVILLIGIVIFRKLRKNSSVKGNLEQYVENRKLIVLNNPSDDLHIKFEMLPAAEKIDEKRLVEIKDSKVLAHVNNLAPEIFKAGTTAGNAIRGSVEVLYRAIIPAGAELSNSQEIKGAVRGIYHDAKGIKGQANLVTVNNTKNVAMNAVASTMGVASMIVGQYYMEQINSELATMSEGISSIADFQDNEYKSKVFALITQIKKITSFQSAILENDELRQAEIANLNGWEQQCIELLGQANLTIVGFSKKGNLDFKEYEKELVELQNWYVYQKTLMELLCKIADLKHTLHFGSVSREQCGALLPTYSEQVKEAICQLNIWHSSQAEKLGINIDESLRKRVGFDGFIHKLPGLMAENYKFRPISENTSDIIATQITAYEIPDKVETIDLFQEDVRVIAKDGKLYYLPESDILEA